MGSLICVPLITFCLRMPLAWAETNASAPEQFIRHSQASWLNQSGKQTRAIASNLTGNYQKMREPLMQGINKLSQPVKNLWSDTNSTF